MAYMREVFCGALLAAVMVHASAAAWGAPGAAKAAAQAMPGAAVGDVERRLKSGDTAQIKAALDDVRMAGRAGAPAIPAIADLLKQGLSPGLTVTAIDTLGDTEAEAATDAVISYARHRTVALRRAAVSALSKTGGPAAVGALRGALSDSDPEVRGLAATALGAMKARAAVPDLFAALDHKVPEAAASLGELCSSADCDRLAGKLGSVPFDVVTSGLDEVLMRSAPEVTDDLKVSIVDWLRDVGTAEAHHFLKGVQARWPARGLRRVKQALDQAVAATAASPGADGSEVAP